jgi:hypothetical protein
MNHPAILFGGWRRLVAGRLALAPAGHDEF